MGELLPARNGRLSADIRDAGLDATGSVKNCVCELPGRKYLRLIGTPTTHERSGVSVGFTWIDTVGRAKLADAIVIAAFVSTLPQPSTTWIFTLWSSEGFESNVRY